MIQKTRFVSCTLWWSAWNNALHAYETPKFRHESLCRLRQANSSLQLSLFRLECPPDTRLDVFEAALHASHPLSVFEHLRFIVLPQDTFAPHPQSCNLRFLGNLNSLHARQPWYKCGKLGAGGSIWNRTVALGRGGCQGGCCSREGGCKREDCATDGVEVELCWEHRYVGSWRWREQCRMSVV